LQKAEGRKSCTICRQEIRQLREAIRDLGKPAQMELPKSSIVSRRSVDYKRHSGPHSSNSNTPRREDIERGVTFYEPSYPGSSSESSEYIDAPDEWTTP